MLKLKCIFLVSTAFFLLPHSGKALEVKFPLTNQLIQENQDLAPLGKGGRRGNYSQAIENLPVDPLNQQELTSVLSQQESAQGRHTIVIARPHSPHSLLQTANSSRAASSEAAQFSDSNEEFIDDGLFDNKHIESSSWNESFNTSDFEYLEHQEQTSTSEQVKELIARSQVEDLTPAEWRQILLSDNSVHGFDDEERASATSTPKNVRPLGGSSENFEEDALRQYDNMASNLMNNVNNAIALFTTLEQEVEELFNTQATILDITDHIVTTCKDAAQETESISPTSSPRESLANSSLDPQLGTNPASENFDAEAHSSPDTSFNAELYRLTAIDSPEIERPAVVDGEAPATELSTEHQL